MSQSAATLLKKSYGVDPRRLNVIPHGVPDLPLADPAVIKASLGLEGRQVILSFGLLGPTKGHELMLDALPAVDRSQPGRELRDRGRHASRTCSKRRARRIERPWSLGSRRSSSASHVRFVDEFAHRVAMTRWLQAADIVVTPYPDLDQTVSGTLSYAMGAGRAIVSTPYAYAAELLADGRGVLVPEPSPEPVRGRAQRGPRGRQASSRPRPQGLRVQPPHGLVGGRRAVPRAFARVGAAASVAGRRCAGGARALNA